MKGAERRMGEGQGERPRDERPEMGMRVRKGTHSHCPVESVQI